MVHFSLVSKVNFCLTQVKFYGIVCKNEFNGSILFNGQLKKSNRKDRITKKFNRHILSFVVLIIFARKNIYPMIVNHYFVALFFTCS